MIDLDNLERLAKAAGGEEWTPTHATRTDLATVWLPDGDSVCRCHGNIGHWPDPIDADDVAEFIATANPAQILALIAEVRALREDLQATKLLAHANAEMFKAERAQNEPLLKALADCREAAFYAAVDNPHLGGAVGDPEEVPMYVEWEIKRLREDANRYGKLAELVEFGEWFVGTDDTDGPRDRHGALQNRYLDDKADMDREMDAALRIKQNTTP